MNTNQPPRALVIGGSLGGLLTAVTLRAIGWRVDVFERSPHSLDSRGGGIVLQPDVVHALHFAGVDSGPTLGVASGDRIFLDRLGEVVQRGYQPQTQTSWNMLYAAMRRTLPEECVHAGEVQGMHHVGLQDNAAAAAVERVRRALEHVDAPADGAQAGCGEQAAQRAADDQGAWRRLLVHDILQ